jgi:hypothetical protein
MFNKNDRVKITKSLTLYGNFYGAGLIGTVVHVSNFVNGSEYVVALDDVGAIRGQTIAVRDGELEAASPSSSSASSSSYQKTNGMADKFSLHETVHTCEFIDPGFGLNLWCRHEGCKKTKARF